MRRTVVPLLISLASTGCYSGSIARMLTPDPPGGDVGPKPVAEVLSAAVGASHAATLALAALDGGVDPSCASLVSGAECTHAGCPFTVQIDAGECRSPIATEGATGFTLVTGTRTEDGAILDADFAQLEFGDGGHWLIARIAALVATSDGHHLDVTYAQQSVEITAGMASATADLEQHVWVADVDFAGSPGDPDDDTYVISGGLQDVEAGGDGAWVMQAAITGATIAPVCRRNPTMGSAFVEEVGAGTSIVLSMLSLGFHSGCDGRADITSAFGTDMFALGGTVGMDLQD